MKKLLFWLVCLMTAMTADAKIKTATLWEDTYTSAIELNAEVVATFKAGDELRIYLTIPAGGANFNICYKSEANGWVATQIPSIGNMWPWLNGGNTYYSVTLTDADITALSGQNIYIEKGENSTITKVTRIYDESASELWSGTSNLGGWGNFESLRYSDKGALANAKVMDDIRVTFTNATEECQIYVCDAASYTEFDGGYFTPSASKDAQSVTFRIANATVLEAIQDKGIVVKGKYATLTKIELVTYAGSYDAVAVTIGSDRIATFSSGKHLSFADKGITPYYASSVETGKVRLTSSTTTWAWQGYMLVGNPGTYTIPVVDEDDASYPSPNYLEQMANGGTVAASTEGTFHYIFAKKNDSDTPAFYKLTADHTLGAKKAYLETTDNIAPTSGARVAMIFEDGDATEIKTIDITPRTAENYYDLQGRRVTNPVKGIYVINGKKIVVK